MAIVEDLFKADPKTASQVASQELPDIVAALDLLVPELISGGDSTTVRRYLSIVGVAAQRLTDMEAEDPDALPPAKVVNEMLLQDAVKYPWIAPSPDGIGIVSVLVDRLRGYAAGLPQQYVQAPTDINGHHFTRFCKYMVEAEYERECAMPLQMAMTTLRLSSRDVAKIMKVSRQAVEKWLEKSPPVERMEKIGVMAKIAAILRFRLKDGMPAVVVRRPAEAYGGRSMLELMINDEHEWLLQSVKESFDFGRVA